MMVESSTWHREFGISKMITTTTNINRVYLYKIYVYTTLYQKVRNRDFWFPTGIINETLLQSYSKDAEMMVESSTWHREFGISKMITTTTNINHVYLYKIRVHHFIPESTKQGLLVPDWYNQ